MPIKPAGPADQRADPRTDHQVIADSLNEPGDFAVIFERHARTMHGFLSRRVGALADDLLGELFTTAFAGRTSYRAQLGDSRPWLYGIATNLVRQHHRAEATRYRALARVPAPDGTSLAPVMTWSMKP